MINDAMIESKNIHAVDILPPLLANYTIGLSD